MTVISTGSCRGWRSQFQEEICHFLGYPYLANYSAICCFEMTELNKMDFSVDFTGGLEFDLCISVLLKRKNHQWISEHNFLIRRKKKKAFNYFCAYCTNCTGNTKPAYAYMHLCAKFTCPLVLFRYENLFADMQSNAYEAEISLQ